MKQHVVTGSRIILGLIFFVFGLNGFFRFLPLEPPPQEAVAFPARYFFPLVKVVETACGALFLVNRYVPLATIVITPVVVNIFFFHLFLDMTNMPMAVVLVVLNLILGLAYRESFAGLLAANAKPRV